MNFKLLYLSSRFALALSAATLLVPVAIAQSANKAVPALTDAQAQVLMQKAQTQPGSPLTQAENNALVRYMVAKQTAIGPAAQQASLGGAATSRSNAPEPSVADEHAATPHTAGSRKPGVIRVGLALTRADFGQEQGPAAGEPIRTLLSQYLGGPKIEVVPLVALLHQQAEEEAKEKVCDYVIFSSIAQKKPTSGMGFLKNVSPVLSMVPMLGLASGAVGAVVAATAVSAVASGVGAMTGQVKAKSDVTFEYQLLAPGNATPVLTNKATLHARSDGEDVITPLIEAAATSIVGKLNPPK